MSSVHYKLRATLEYRTLQFDGLSISANELKREVCAKENIKAESFDLLLTNAHTKRNYTGEDLIPRNSSIIVQRVPRDDAEKLPKIQNVNMGMVVKNESASSSATLNTHINGAEFEKMPEEERLAHIKHVSTVSYHSSNYQKKPSSILIGPPPPTYTCNRCYSPGHWFKNCPMLNTRRTTGIPSQELMETTSDDPLAMLHPSGKHVVPIMHWMARQHKKNVEENPVVERSVPNEFVCPLCQHILKEAVLTTCCGNSFCAECLSQTLLDSEDRKCPGEKCTQTQLPLDAIVPNRLVRQAVQAWEAAGSSNPEAQEAKRIRIGLQPSASTTVPSSLPAENASPSVDTQASTTTTPAVSSPSVVSTAEMSVTPSIPVPALFTQPPPTLAPVSAAPLVTQTGTVLQTTTTLQSTAQAFVPPVLPPIPGVGVPVQPLMVAGVFDRPPPVMGIPPVPSGPQFLDVWNSFLNRNESKNRPAEKHRKTKRRRSRSSSVSSVSSHEERVVRRNERESRRGNRRTIRKDERSLEEKRGRDRYPAQRIPSDRDRRPYVHEFVRDRGVQRYHDKSRPSDDRTRREDRRRRENRKERQMEERTSKRRKEDEKEKEEPVLDEDEAAIDDALEEAKQLESIHSGSDNEVDVEKLDVESPEVHSKEKLSLIDEVKDDDSAEPSQITDHPVQEADAEHTSEAENEEPAVSETDKFEAAVPPEDSENRERSPGSGGEKKKHKKHKKHRKHRRENKDDGTDSSGHKEKKAKKHKKEKKNKRERDVDDEKRKDRKKEKKEKKDKKHRKEKEERRRSKSDVGHESDNKRPLVGSSKTTAETNSKADSIKQHPEQTRLLMKSTSSKASKVEASTDIEEDKVILNEKQIREAFSPPPFMKKQKITLNL